MCLSVLLEVKRISRNLNHHIKTAYDKLKPFKCSDCDFACLKKVDLQIHESQEHQQTISCEICGLCFPQKVDLQFHMSGKVINPKVL